MRRCRLANCHAWQFVSPVQPTCQTPRAATTSTGAIGNSSLSPAGSAGTPPRSSSFKPMASACSRACASVRLQPGLARKSSTADARSSRVRRGSCAAKAAKSSSAVGLGMTLMEWFEGEAVPRRTRIVPIFGVSEPGNRRRSKPRAPGRGSLKDPAQGVALANPRRSGKLRCCGTYLTKTPHGLEQTCARARRSSSPASDEGRPQATSARHFSQVAVFQAWTRTWPVVRIQEEGPRNGPVWLVKPWLCRLCLAPPRRTVFTRSRIWGARFHARNFNRRR